MLGVVLCGGQSSRMGTDKGLLKLQANTWAQTAVEKISSLSIPFVISVNKTQYEAYSAIFPVAQLIMDDNSLDLHGPLCGVMSVHMKFPDEDLLILACDMPLMENSLLKELLQQAGTNPRYDAYIFQNENEPEPFCGIYKSSGLSTILGLYQQKQLARHSMKYMLENVSAFAIPLPADKKQCFRNFNAHAELNGL